MIGRALGVISFLAVCCYGGTAASLNLWIIPAENAGPGRIAAGEEIAKSVDALNRRFADTQVIVANTTDPVLKMQLLAWNPAFAVPNASLVISQTGTLQALAAYAAASNVSIRVRFITWDEAFGLISGLNPDARSKDYPDVIQIGSTWKAYLASRRVTMSRPHWEVDRGNWADLPGLPASSLPYITDVRLLYYWKRLPSALPGSREFVINTSSWSALVDSVRDKTGTSDTIAFPTGLTLNVLHDYAPLIWAGNGPFIARGLFGWRVDLTSPAALAIPLELQRRAIDMSRPREPRTLITFPESSHEDADRIFVNGGYRVIEEPASFIDRWRQDFRQRHEKDGLRFWDYAAAAVPPKSFKGGSDLAVTRGTANPRASFALADFLATDEEFTKILSQSGFLPSGRRGYGADILTDSLTETTGYSPEIEHFVDSVQKAIQQGVDYDPLPKWPVELENRRVQEAFQVIWRRMGERDPGRLRAAAAEAEWMINSRIYWPDEFWSGLLEARWALLGMLLLALGVAGYFIYRRLQAQRALNLLLFLHRAHRHDAAKFLGDNFFGLASAAKRDGTAGSVFLEEVLALSLHFKDKLVPHIEKIAAGQFADFFQKPVTMRLDDIAEAAYLGATYIFEAKSVQPTPCFRYVSEDLDKWKLAKMPYALLVALEEWFLNSIQYAAGKGFRNPVLSIKTNGSILTVDSQGDLDPIMTEILTRKPEIGDLSDGRQGLKLIRNILYYGYGSRVRIAGSVQGGTTPVIRISIPLKPHLRRVLHSGL